MRDKESGDDRDDRYDEVLSLPQVVHRRSVPDELFGSPRTPRVLPFGAGGSAVSEADVPNRGLSGLLQAPSGTTDLMTFNAWGLSVSRLHVCWWDLWSKRPVFEVSWY